MPREYRRKPRRPGPKLLGLDLGERRIGVAVSDDTGIIASPERILDLRRASLADVAGLAVTYKVDGIIVGLPKGMSGSEGYQARETRAMAAEIEALVDVPIIFWDERLSSQIADQALSRRVKSPRDRRTQLDAIAAAVTLQSYMDANPIDRSTPGPIEPESRS
ncbi:MAG TPA: Holliday junction resolvase RuvX [Thermomicrobiales bacterium]|nr:Holliday junction resolvase RuvX [Thermomicrobiales bacterium]